MRYATRMPSIPENIVVTDDFTCTGLVWRYFQSFNKRVYNMQKRDTEMYLIDPCSVVLRIWHTIFTQKFYILTFVRKKYSFKSILILPNLLTL